MYSHGSSARIGSGKRGHGGRNYRPPPERKSRTGPPPLKECTCLVQFEIPEYQHPELPSRRHVAFGGRENVEQCEKTLRNQFGVHLVVPGKRQSGPVAIAAKSSKEAIPAAAQLLELLQTSTLAETQGFHRISGQIQVNVQNAQDHAISGTWHTPTEDNRGMGMNLPFYLFHGTPSVLSNDSESEEWSILVCRIVDRRAEDDSSDGDNNASSSPLLESLRICVDNAAFHLGSSGLDQLSIFFREQNENGSCATTAFAVGKRRQAEILNQEVRKFLLNNNPSGAEKQDEQRAKESKKM